MAANTLPVYGRTSDLQLAGSVMGTTANTATDGTGAGNLLIYTADATEGSYVQYVRLKVISTIAATVVRIWYCSATGAYTAGTTNTASNTTMVAEISIAAWTLSQLAASPVYDIPINLPMPASTKLLISFGTSTGAGTTGFNPLIVAMKY
jgi:hypothetical protein